MFGVSFSSGQFLVFIRDHMFSGSAIPLVEHVHLHMTASFERRQEREKWEKLKKNKITKKKNTLLFIIDTIRGYNDEPRFRRDHHRRTNESNISQGI